MDWFMPSQKIQPIVPPPAVTKGTTDSELDLIQRKRASYILTSQSGINPVDNRPVLGS